MKNLKTFEEIVNENYATRVGDKVTDYHKWYGEPSEDVSQLYDIISTELNVNKKDLFRIDSQDDDFRTILGFSAAEKAFSSGKIDNIKLPDSGISGPFLSVNKKMKIAKYEEQGFSMFIFTNKSNF